MKKTLALLLALVMCLGILAGCQQDPAETTTAPTTTAATQGTTETTTAPTEAEPLLNVDIYPIDYDGTLTVTATKADPDKVHNYLLMEEVSGIDIEWQYVTWENVALLFVGDQELPDILFNCGLSAAQIREFGQAGKLINFLDPEILDKMPNMKAWYEAHPQCFDAVIDSEGAAYAPAGHSGGYTAPGNLFYVRLDMTEEAGITELPTTIEGFLELCATLKEYYKDVEGYAPLVTNGTGSMNAIDGHFVSFFFPAFGELMEAGLTTTVDGKSVAVGFATEQYKHYLEFMRTMYAEGYLDSLCYESDSATNKAKLIEKTTTMNPFATYLTPDNFESGEMEFQVYPPMSSEYQSEARWLAYNNTVVRSYLITTDCTGEDLDAALAFLDLFYTPRDNPAYDKDGVKVSGVSLWLGAEGEDFVVNEEEGTYVVLDHDGYDSSSAWLHDAGHGGSVAIEFDYLEDSGTGLMMKALGVRDVLMPKQVKVQRTSLLLLTEDEQDLYTDTWPDLQSHVSEYAAAFITGQKDIEADWETYIKGLEDMGLQDVIDAYQAALDRYNAG